MEMITLGDKFNRGISLVNKFQMQNLIININAGIEILITKGGFVAQCISVKVERLLEVGCSQLSNIGHHIFWVLRTEILSGKFNRYSEYQNSIHWLLFS
jgi:hypothetical protein